MKTFTFLLLGLCLSLPVFAQEKPAIPQLAPEELDKLVAPIALYPDSLIALVLPASTEVADVVLAARYLAREGDPAAIDNQHWNDSVKSLARFPELVAWMDENLAWTQQMGEVFEAQPADVMNAIQRLRAQARAAGLLTDTPQQKVVMQEQVICIVPAEPDVIYVPRYDPEILWLRRPYHGPFMTFGLGFGIGNWLFYDCDWFGHGIWMHNRHSGWAYRPAWRRPTTEVHVVVGSPWRPNFRHEHRVRPAHRTVSVAVRPSIMREHRPDNHGRPSHSARPGFDGRSDHGNRSDNHGDRPGNRVDRPDNRGERSAGRPERSGPPPAHGNRPNAPVPPPHAVSSSSPSVTPPPPPTSERPSHRPNVGSAGQQPREGPRGNRGSGDSSTVRPPRPSSYTTPPAGPVTPSAPAAPVSLSVERPQTRPSSGSSAQSPRERPRMNRDSGDSSAVYTPRPPSPTPTPPAASAPPPPPSPRPSRSESSGSSAPAAASSGHRPMPAAQPAIQERKEGDDPRQSRERGPGRRP